MERAIFNAVRGIVCAVTLAGLAACNGDGSSSASNVMPEGSQSHGTGSGMHIPTSVQSGDPTTPGTSNKPPVTSPTDTDHQQEGNAAPTISGAAAAQVSVGQTFNFTPAANDADGDSLTFQIQGKPSWASFDSSTGHLTGKPGAADVGSNDEILISVSDGEHHSALPSFAIDVVAQSDGNATLAWEPPTQNTDGSALTNLKGYRIHYGTQSGAYENTVSVDNAGVTSFVIENLTPGTYFFAVSAITTNGLESELSAEASKTI